jgi:hypothetical protein
VGGFGGGGGNRTWNELLSERAILSTDTKESRILSVLATQCRTCRRNASSDVAVDKCVQGSGFRVLDLNLLIILPLAAALSQG